MSVTDEIKQRIDLIDFISRYTPLKKAGSSYKANCPFHEERTPSFVVFPHTGSWRCFGACGVGGDLFDFAMRKENLDFREALEMLADEAGVELTQQNNNPTLQRKPLLYEINQAASDYFQYVLRHHPVAQVARDYLQNRGIDDPTQELFELGFALESWHSLRDHLYEKGYSYEDQLAAGLIKRHEERQNTYDAFRDRLMIPIRDRQGRHLGFGGRVLGDGQPKYLNTGETALFRKSHIIYGIDLGHKAINDADKVVIVEGYMDVIAAHQHGYKNVVACMGTALTAEQLKQLQRYTDNFVLALDADSAGQQATIRGLNQARQALSKVRKPTFTTQGRLNIEERLAANLNIVSMPPGQDPDDLIRQNPAQWPQLIQDAQPLVDYYFGLVSHQYDLSSAYGKGNAVTELSPLIAELGDDIERQHYIQKLSRLVQIDERTIGSRVQAAAKTLRVISTDQAKGKRAQGQRAKGKPNPSLRRPNLPQPPGHVTKTYPEMPPEPYIPEEYGIHEYGTHEYGLPPAAQPAPRSYPVAHQASATQLTAEDHLLANLLRQPNLVVWMAGASDILEISPLVEGDLNSVENREIFRHLKRFLTSDEAWDVELFQETLPEQLHGRLAHLISYGLLAPEREERLLREDVIKVLLRLRIQELNSTNTNIQYVLAEAQRNGDQETLEGFKKINNQTLRDRFHLDKLLVSLNSVLFAPDSRSVEGKQMPTIH